MQSKNIKLIVLALLLGSFNAWAQYTEDEWKERDEWMDVSRIFNAAGLDSGNNVADVGCHEGYLSMHLAKEVGEKGKVYSVDIKEYRLEALQRNAKKRGLKNITTVLGDYDDPKLPEKALDVVFVVDTYHEMEDYMAILGHIKKSLKPGGRIVLIEKLKDHARNKSRKDQTRAHTLSPKYVRKELKEAGFSISTEIKDMGDWENEKSKTIWMLVGVVPSA
ncbi:class I SAM-dependent methyltransferase [Poritiphilus flavus]|uniref:Methyltransferase domain-containing protein n=1 Tax=Poritiphilus flavus TaxID=2697053 RepID=A0A6L9EEQ6_9FLAO|nr:class I SAM-dependent methyltransferase [Poritiphilus flavus]NAS13244.1 methyltransferase domain-containing protein [Poritiphilus flavus]